MKQKSCFKKVLTLIAILSMGIANVIPTVEAFANTTNENAVIIQDESEEEAQEKPFEESITLQSDKPVPSSKDVEDEVLLDESANANDSPVIDNADFETIYYNEDGTMMYNGEPVYVGSGNEEIPANLNELMMAGVPTKLRAAGATIEYLGQIKYSYSTVGHFKVNGKTAFCLQHPKPTPGTGTPNNGLEPYKNDAIKRILYYGWEGPKNIFTDANQGIVITSLVLSKYYNGDISDAGAPGWAELDQLAQTGDVPNHQINISKSKLSVNIVSGMQKSESTTIQATTNNQVAFNVPSGMTMINETTGAKVTDGLATVNGGQTIHFEASLQYTNNWSTGTLKGSVKEFQPLVIRPLDAGYQEIGTWRWYDDPTQTISIAANFFARTGHFELLKLSEMTNKPMPGVTFAVTIDGKTTEHTTNAEGKIRINDILDSTVVTYKEIAAPKGYAIDPTEYTATIVAGNVLSVTVTNNVEKFVITGMKQKEIFNEKDTFKDGQPVYETIAGENITFDIKALTDITLPDGTVVTEKDAIVDTVTTDAEGKFTSKELLAGEQNKYQLVERDVPDNYRQPSDEQTIFSHAYGDGTKEIFNYDLETPIDNELKTGEWNINKKNELTGLGLDGARFHLVGISDNVKDVQFIFVSSALGNTFKLKEGTYKVTEVEYPNGFSQSFGESESKIIEIKDTETTVTDWNNSPSEAKTPKMGTMAYVENGGKDFDPTVENKLYDKISSFNFESDSYFFVTKVIGEKTGNVYYEAEGNQKIDTNGEVIVETIIPANTVQNENVYFVELAYPTKEDYEKGKKPYAKHDGKGDYGQTLFYKTKPVTPPTPKTPTPKTPTPKTPTPKTPTPKTPTPKAPPTPSILLPQTGEGQSSSILLVIGSMIVLIAISFYSRKKITE